MSDSRPWNPPVKLNHSNPTMPDTDFMISTTKIDFDVDVIATSGESALFAALRKGGTERISTHNGPRQTHVMGVWHFVAVSGQGNNTFQMRQWHIPCFKMANALRIQESFFKSESYPAPIYLNFMPLPTRMHGRHKFEFLMGSDGKGFHVDESFVLNLKNDIPLLEKAREKVRERDGEYFIPRLKTAAGHPVQSPSRELLEAIAFEKLTRPRMTAGNFGVYSAYCTYRDFDDSIQMPDSLIQELLEGQFQYDPDEISDDIHELFLNTQRQLLSKPIWGRGIEMTVAEAAPILAEGMASLTRSQRVQFILMNGMHTSGLFLPLATILGLCDFDDYAYQMCSAWAPDSPEEQDCRKETAYIKLYGELAGD